MKGQAIFVCPNCGERFKSVDVDYRSTNHAIPMACPYCGTKTLDKAWNQTNLSDGALITIILSCLILPIVIRRGIVYFFDWYYKCKIKQLVATDDEEKEGTFRKISHFFARKFAHMK